MGVYGRLLTYISEIKREISIKVFLNILVSSSFILQAIFMAKIVTRVFSKASINSIVPSLSIVLSIIVIRSVITFYLETYNKIIAARIKEKIRIIIFDKIVQLGPGFLSNKRSGKITSLVLDGIESLEPFFVNYIPQIISVSVIGLGLGAYLCYLDVVSGVILILSMLLCIIIPYLSIPLVNRNIINYWDIYSVITSQYIDTIQGMLTLKALNASQQKGLELEKNAVEFYKQAIKNTAISLVNSGLMLVLTSCVASVTVVIAAYRANIGILNISSASAFLFLAVEASRPMLDLNRYWHSSFLGISVASELFELLDTEQSICEISNSDSASLDKKTPSIELQNICFSYREGKKVINNVTMNIESSSTVAIVGASGSGKTTLLNLLLRFYDVSDGKILLNGVDIKNYYLDYLRNKISIVFQETFLFGGTIKENLLMGNVNASDDEIYAAMKAVNMHDFVNTLPDSYNTIIEEGALNLSGGQKQRLAIARAIIKNCPILLLDEATSSIDSESEEIIQAALKQLRKKCTIVIVAHRLSTVKDADKIFVLNKGSLIEEGNHNELVMIDGVYKSLIKSQWRDLA